MIKLIATDIDGTLLKDGTLMIDPEYMTVIEKLTSKGIIFVACSGRQFISERKLFAPVCDKLLYITDGGTVVRTPHKILKVHTLPEDVWHGMSCCCGCQFVPVVVEFGELSVNGNTRIFFAVHVQDLLGTFISGLISPPCHNQAGGITAAAI